ncbi:MAG: signal peptidase II [Porticoccaceae bacterium]|nr:signal peptidase II [Porticoccaceae bacterium]
MPNQSLSASKQLLTLLSIALLVFVFDQLTKIWIVNHFVYGASEAVNSFFNVVRVHNFGAAFSFLNNEGGWQRWGFSVFAALVSLVILVWITRLSPQQKLEGLALALILGGALGNLYDRIALGYVVDFLDFHWSGRHFPAFNIADSAITVGAVLILIEGFLKQSADNPKSENKG